MVLYKIERLLEQIDNIYLNKCKNLLNLNICIHLKFN
jgi:hypothetical protein